MHGVETRSAADVAIKLDIHWVVHRNVWDQLDYREVCAHWVPKILQMITNLIVWAFLVSIGHITLIKQSSFGAEIWLITHNLKPENRCVVEKLPSPSSKENGNIVISKDDRGKRLGTINMCLFWISWAMVTLSADCYCDTLRLQRPFFTKDLGYFTKVLSFCKKIPGAIHLTGQLFMAVHLIVYGSVPILCSVFYFSLNS